jgi:hypothetical protein
VTTKSFREQTYYELLEVPHSASMDEIREAYQRSVRLYDPENVALYPVGDPALVDELKRLLLEAMEILTDDDLRGEYDRSLGLGGNAESAEIDARAAEARKQGEAEVLHAAEAQLKQAPPPATAGGEGAPRQLVMQELVSRAESVHSTAPRYAISYIPHPPRPVPEPASGPAPEQEPVPAAEAVAEPQPEPVTDRAPPPPPPSPPTSPVGAGDAVPAAPPEPAPAPAPPAVPPPSHARLDDAPVLAQEAAIQQAETALAAVSAHVQRGRDVREPQRPRPLEIPADAEFNGELLRQVRKSRALSIVQLAERTRISSRHLENVEADRYDALPPPVYLRGILMNLARELQLDPVRVSKSYLGLVEKSRGRVK